MSKKKFDGTVYGSWLGFAIAFAIVGAWTIAAAIMLVTFGAWGWVVWPAAVAFFLSRTSKALLQTLKQIKESKEDPLAKLLKATQ